MSKSDIGLILAIFFAFIFVIGSPFVCSDIAVRICWELFGIFTSLLFVFSIWGMKK